MLYVLFGKELNGTVENIDRFFKNIYEDDWFRHPLVKEMVEDIDNSKLEGMCVVSPVLGQIPVTELSGGVKTLIFLLNAAGDDLRHKMNLTNCGRNCEKWIKKISQMRDIEVCCTGVHLTFKDVDIEAVCLNDNSKIHNYQEWVMKMLEYEG